MLHIAVLLGTAMAPMAQSGSMRTTEARAASVFDRMKMLVGTWRPQANETASLRIVFSLTAGGTVLVESWRRGDQPHSLTLYHLDGKSLIATHYCPQGNQPRLALTAEASNLDARFDFRDATDLDRGESYLVRLAFELSNPDAVVRRETYRTAGGDEQSTLTLTRER